MLNLNQRRQNAYTLRERAAAFYRDLPAPTHADNGDQERYKAHRYYANYSKGLPHDAHGEVDPAAYKALLHALDTGKPADFAAIPQGCTSAGKMPFVDPQAGLAYDLEGIDSHQLSMPPCYAFRSEGEIGEIAENYWLALARDVAFAEYGTDTGTDHDAILGGSLTGMAATDLSSFSVFDGPKAGGNVTIGTLFRGFTPADLAGPYVSQFLLLDIPYGSEQISQKIAYALPDTSYMIDPVAWLDVQRGCNPGVKPQPVAPADRRYLYRGRDLAQYVHIDELFQAYLNACLILISPPERGGLGAPLAEGNPYAHGGNQTGFGTLGEPNFKTIVAEVATRALKAMWYQKWFVHRRIRPEVYGGRIHFELLGGQSYEFHPGEFAKLQSCVLKQTRARNVLNGHDTYLLPMAFPEGSPLHPAYGAGHATVAGACVTVLKALFREETPIAGLMAALPPAFGIGGPVMPSADGTALVPYGGADAGALTVGGELNKLAANIGIARNFAGVHWRSDYTQSMLVGEKVGLYFLQDYVQTYNEDVYFTLTRFDGTKVVITKQQTF